MIVQILRKNIRTIDWFDFIEQLYMFIDLVRLIWIESYQAICFFNSISVSGMCMLVESENRICREKT